MNIVLLGGISRGASLNYRGLSRITPSYQDKLPEEHEVNQAFFWYCAEGGERGIVHNLALAKKTKKCICST